MPEPHWAGRDVKPGEGPTSLTDLTDVTGEPGYGKGPIDDGSETFELTRVVTQEDLDIIASVEWHDLALLSGFTNQGGEYAPARYRLTFNNNVFVEGHISAADRIDETFAGMPITQLPPECTPGYRLMFNAPNDGPTVARVDLHPNGIMSFEGFFGGTGDATFFSLNQITYSVGGVLTLLEARFGK